MFVSKQYLHYNLGVDERIATFFVDRKVPENNRYWKDRYLYVAKGTGYLFIPLFFDLQFKCGVDIECLMSEGYLRCMEEILNSAALHEFEEINFRQHLENCKIIMEGSTINYALYNDLLLYFADDRLKPYKNLGTPIAALNRGDTMLFSLCYLDLNKEVADKILETWYALVPSFLLMDDVSDLREDKENNEENSISDFAPGTGGVQQAIQFLRNKFNLLKMYNSKLGLYFENSLEHKIQTPYVQSLLSNR